MRKFFLHTVLASSILAFGCSTTKMPIARISCPDLNSIFPINKSNYSSHLGFEAYDTIYYDSSFVNPVKTGKKVINTVEVYLRSHKGRLPMHNYLAIDQVDSATSISHHYQIQGDSITNYHTIKYSFKNKSFKIGESNSVIFEGYLDHEKGYKICWKEALAIANLNLEKRKKKNNYSHMYMGRSKTFEKPFWIFTVVLKNNKNHYYTVDGVSGKFKKSNFMDIYPGAIKGK